MQKNRSWRQYFVLEVLWILVPVALLAGLIAYREYDYRPPRSSVIPAESSPYKDPSQPVSVRVEDLLAQMTLEEKIGQMAVVEKNSLKKNEDVGIYGLGAVISGAGAKPPVNTPAGWKEMVDEIKSGTDASRLKIPILFGIDATHGHANVPGATVFPHAIGYGAAADPELVKLSAEATAAELAATGINWNFAPVLDAPEDIRWGRAYEAFSSDPDLNAQLGSAYVEGFSSSTVLSTAKHFVGIGSMQWGTSDNKNYKIDQGAIDDNEQRLEEYLAPYRAVVDEGVDSVMIGLAKYNDQRVIDNKYLVTEKLKGELGFKGIVVSDWFGTYEYSGVSRYISDVKTINAGVDMAMLPFDYKVFVKDVSRAVKNEDIKMERIDDATRRILTKKFEAGLFDQKRSTGLETIGLPEHRVIARRAVASSAVLLKNNDALPLSGSENIRISGSAADNIGRQSGAWTIEWQGFEGNDLPGAASILGGIQQFVPNVEYNQSGQFGTGRKAEVGIVVVSEESYAEGWGDNEYPTLSEEDKSAISNMKLAAEKLIIVSATGRPILMTNEIASADAVLAVWLPGSEGGGVADVLFGASAFRGRLPIAWPKTISQLPIRTNGTTADNTSPLYPVGYGL